MNLSAKKEAFARSRNLRDPQFDGCRIPDTMIDARKERPMFETDKGLGPGKWLKWFMAPVILVGICSFWPEDSFIGGTIVGLCGAIAIAIARCKIRSIR